MNSEERNSSMRRFIRLAVLACAALASLALTGTALAAYSPSLAARSVTNAPGQPTRMLFEHYQSLDDDATAKDTIYVPLGYGVNLTQPVGTPIGSIDALIVLRKAGNAQVEATGTVVADNPANYPPASNRCTPGQQHEAVWRADVTVAGTPIQVPMYIDHVSAGQEAAYAAAKIQLCLSGPEDPQSPAGAQLFDAVFDVNGVFTNPASTGRRIWHALFTPYIAGTTTPNPAGTTEGQAWVPASVSLSLAVKRLKRGVVLLQGRLSVDGSGIFGPRVEFYVRNRRVGRATLRPPGRYSFRTRIKRKTRFQARVNIIGNLSRCPAPAVSAAPCRTASLWIVARSRTVLARPKK
jgi:hypothetical protein